MNQDIGKGGEGVRFLDDKERLMDRRHSLSAGRNSS